VIKNHEKRALELIEKKKQMTFDVPDGEPRQKTPSKKPGKTKETYWICVNGHVFKHGFRVHPDRADKLRCPVCRGRVRNQTSRSTYLYYLDREGRGDKKEYRRDKIRGEKRASRKKGLLDTEAED